MSPMHDSCAKKTNDDDDGGARNGVVVSTLAFKKLLKEIQILELISVQLSNT